MAGYTDAYMANLEVDHLRKELAEAKAAIEVLEATSVLRMNQRVEMQAALEAANARIAELEERQAEHDDVWGEHTATLMEWQDKAARAERAEAECKDLCGALLLAVRNYDAGVTIPHEDAEIIRRGLKIARAALNPSPAEDKT